MGAIPESDPEPKNPAGLHMAYAKWQEQIGNLTEARDSYEYVLGEKPKSVDAILGLARLDQLAGRNNAAEQGYRKALKIGRNDAHALDAAGQFYASQKQWDQAVEMLNKAMMAAPGETTYRYHLAVALAQSGDVQKSLLHFIKTVGPAEAHYNVGYILFEQGDLAAAEQQFLQAVIKKPDLQQAQVMLDDVRRTQENRLLLANSPGQSARRPAENTADVGGAHSWPASQSVETANQARRATVRPVGATSPQRPASTVPPTTQPQTLSPLQMEQRQNQTQQDPISQR